MDRMIFESKMSERDIPHYTEEEKNELIGTSINSHFNDSLDERGNYSCIKKMEELAKGQIEISKYIRGRIVHTKLLDNLNTGINDTKSINAKGNMNCLIAVEELAELQVEILEYLVNNGNKLGITEELGDVSIGTDYVKQILGISEQDVDKAVDIKLERERQRLEYQTAKKMNKTE